MLCSNVGAWVWVWEDAGVCTCVGVRISGTYMCSAYVCAGGDVRSDASLGESKRSQIKVLSMALA